jgi:oxepin-CoA hydrolase / 3-oxo-5,6-dehydrosuberyl-CoA semialdehyde dehydrogenase
MQKLENYALGKWMTGDGDGQLLFNAVNGDPVAAATSKGLDFAGMLEYGRKTGGPALRKMTFHERGRMLRALALYT